jgi:hypothetical protein
MSEFVEVKTGELTGAALDYAVAAVHGYEWTDDPSEVIAAVDRKRAPVVTAAVFELGVVVAPGRGMYRPSTDWSQGGPLIAKYGVSLDCLSPVNAWEAFVWGGPAACDGFSAEAETPLIVACRAIVASVLGDTVSVPKELLA